MTSRSKAIVRGDDVAAEVGHLAAFAARVRGVGDGHAPRPLAALARLLADCAAASPAPAADTASHATRRVTVAKVAGLGILSKLGLGVTAAAAGVAGAGPPACCPAAPTTRCAMRSRS
jgi:hypothetical protein